MYKISMMVIVLVMVVSVVFAKDYTMDVFTGTVKVSIDSGETWFSPVIEMKLKESYMIKTGADSFCEVKMPDQGIFRLTDNSIVTLSKITGKNKKVKMKRGGILFNIFHKVKADETFEVETSVAVAAVRGTQFKVSFDGEAQTTAVVDGAVGVTRNVKIPKSGMLGEQLKKSLEVIATKEQELTITLSENKELERLMENAKNVRELRREISLNKTYTQKKIRLMQNATRLINQMRLLDDDDSQDAKDLDSLIDKARDMD